MKLLLAILLPLVGYCAEPDLARMSWPKVIQDFPVGEKSVFTSGTYQISRGIPADPRIQVAGGSGGPIVEVTLRDSTTGWTSTLTDQSVGERLLEDYAGRPQIEMWSRGGGGYWIRCLYRYVTAEYRCVRIDEFEEGPRHDNAKASKTKPPFAPHGEGDEGGRTLYFVETRLPPA